MFGVSLFILKLSNPSPPGQTCGDATLRWQSQKLKQKRLQCDGKLLRTSSELALNFKRKESVKNDPKKQSSRYQARGTRSVVPRGCLSRGRLPCLGFSFRLPGLASGRPLTAMPGSLRGLLATAAARPRRAVQPCCMAALGAAWGRVSHYGRVQY